MLQVPTVAGTVAAPAPAAAAAAGASGFKLGGGLAPPTAGRSKVLPGPAAAPARTTAPPPTARTSASAGDDNLLGI